MVKETIEQFLKIQALDSRINTVEKELARIPELLKESLSAYEAVNAEKNKAESEYKELADSLRHTEGSLAERREMLAHAQKKLTSVQNNKEYEAALKELDSLRKTVLDLETTASGAKERIAVLDAVISEKDIETAAKEEFYKTEKSEKELENKSLFDELAALKKKREDFVATIKKSNLSKYERIRTARNNLAVVQVVNEVCTGCNMKIPPQMAVEVKKEKELLQCPYCQRFLYHKEEKHAEVS